MNRTHITNQPRTDSHAATQTSNQSKRSAAVLLAPVLLGLAMQGQAAAQIIIPPVLPVTTTDEATSMHRVKVVRSTVAYNCPATGAWVDIPGATAAFSVAALHSDLFIGRFSAESAFSGAAGYGRLRMLINTTEMQPAAGTDFAFDSNDGGSESGSSWEGHAFERSAALPVSTLAVNATVKVQCMAPANTVFRIDDWHFTAEQLH